MTRASTIRRAILVALIGASLWALAPIVTVGLGDTHIAYSVLRLSEREYNDAWEALVVRSVLDEILVATIAAAGWIIAGLLRAPG